MRLTCPTCGCTASAEAWENDAEQRGFMLLLAEMPSPVAIHLLRYCGLFRAPQAARGLSWKKANRLAQELSELVLQGYVHTKGKADRNCTPHHWAASMDIMIEMGATGTLTLPMKNHNYLRSIVWQQADKAGAEAEQQVPFPPQQPAQPTHTQPPYERDELSQFDRAYIKEHGEKSWKALSGTGDVQAFKDVTKQLAGKMSIRDTAPAGSTGYTMQDMTSLLNALEKKERGVMLETSKDEVAQIMALPSLLQRVSAVKNLMEIGR